MSSRIAPLLLCLFPAAGFAAERSLPMNLPPFEQLVPPDKNLDPAWVASLTARGTPKFCTGAELNFIGMPIGGMFSGHLLLSGDGQLWNWDIFNDFVFTGWSGNYGPVKPTSPLEQRFSLLVNGLTVALDRTGFSTVTFRGEYPLALVTYEDPQVPVAVRLRAFSPFIPLNPDNSSLPLTIMHYTVHNRSDQPVHITLQGTLENFVLDRQRGALNGSRVNRVVTDGALTILEETVTPAPTPPETADVIVEDWSMPTFTPWTPAGPAFGAAPLQRENLTPEQTRAGLDKLGSDTRGFVTSLQPAAAADAPTPAGTLTSAPFRVERAHLYVWMRPEGRLRGGAGLDLLVDGRVVAAIRPKYSRMDVREPHLHALDLTPYAGREAVIRLVHESKDAGTGLTVGTIFQSDREILFNSKTGKIEPHPEAEGFGTMALALLDGPADLSSGNQHVPASERLTGMLGRLLTIPPGETRELTFALAWNFPNMRYLRPAIQPQGRWYASKFATAADVVRYFVQHRERLTADTQTWHDTWYDSTLPYWFLDRTMIPVGNLATSTNHRFTDGRWWAWEGVGSCEGTCGHVYSYAQSVATLFPSIEREQRERVDFGPSQYADGGIDARGECRDGVAVDAQACYVLRALREHRMSADAGFLRRNWPKIRSAMDYLIAQDGRESGVLRGAQHNTLDSKWYGEIAWLSGLYQAALRAAAHMATLNDEPAYAERCTRIADAGQLYLTANLFNGEYYQNKLDPAHPDAINSGSGCLIDQVSGQAWAGLLDLPRVFPAPETTKSLQSLWRYNFCPDAGAYREAFKSGRRYVDRGEAGVLMATFPRPDWDFAKASGRGQNGLFAGYFNECMTGFEHQLAALMVREGLVTEGLAIERAIHDRYAPAKRNPYNEVECGDFYGRAMASHGVYLAACGFDYDGPAGKLGFAPRLTPNDFKCAFTASEGWGTYAQRQSETDFRARVEMKWGKLKLKTLMLTPTQPLAGPLAVEIEGLPVKATATAEAGRIAVRFADAAEIPAGSHLQVSVRSAN